jgi:hypothetical protein
MRRVPVKTAVAVILATCLAALWAAVAVADPTNNHRIPVNNSVLNGTYTGFCSFPVDVNVVRSNQYVVSSSIASDGTLTERIAGFLELSYTNDLSGATVTENVSGPATIVVYPDFSVSVSAQGPGYIFNGPGTPAFALGPGIFVGIGNVFFSFDPSGNYTSFSVSGRVIDVCTLLS